VEVETALAELKTTQRGPKQLLCSRSPELVAQEVWAHLLVHDALRAVMHTAALAEDLDLTGCRCPHPPGDPPPGDRGAGLSP
jgi:hypothetical protein